MYNLYKYESKEKSKAQAALEAKRMESLDQFHQTDFSLIII